VDTHSISSNLAGTAFGSRKLIAIVYADMAGDSGSLRPEINCLLIIVR
jgi:hypothetical protein